MAEVIVNSASAAVPPHQLNGHRDVDPAILKQKYSEERSKRLREVGAKQYIDPLHSEKYKHFLEDPCVEPGTPVDRPVPDGGHCKVLIVGAGFGGILFAVKLVEAGFKLDDLLIVDPAGGFGGTWWWNRYPGLMCDVESYIYMPLLEEMGYMPKKKYSMGDELREYADSIAVRYNLHKRAMFQSAGKNMSWDESRNEWVSEIVEKPKGGPETKITVRSDFVIFATGLLNNAKLPDMAGFDDFQGQMFHTARWDYTITGGTQQNPVLTGLEGKIAAFVGTGATAIQAVPHLGKYAKELYVFQRTPSSVDRRDNRDTDPSDWKYNIANRKGWQRERSRNFNSWLSNVNPKPSEDLVSDQWSQCQSMSALIGGPKKVTVKNMAEHVDELHALDSVRTERIRRQTQDIVKDPTTAKSLQAWYPTWCKRPCFHDEYLQTFNSPNVHLVDTEGKGIDRVTPKGVKVGDKEYEADIIIWGTGFMIPRVGSAAGKASIWVTGKGGAALEELNDNKDLATLHGVVSCGFPNMFWPGPLQAGVAANQMFVLDQLSTHVAYIMTEATRKAGGKPVIEPNAEAAEEWAVRIAAGAAQFAAIAGCTPGYLNGEGAVDRMKPEDRVKAARYSVWGDGIESFISLIEDWRAQGRLDGLEVTPASATTAV